jgi:hypothetical protein
MTAKKQNAEDNLKDNAPEGIALTDAEKVKARKEGAIEDVKEAAKDTHRQLTDGQNPGEAPTQQWHGSDEIQAYAHNLELGVESFEDAISEKDQEKGAIPDEKVYGLLALERNGQNRTPYVKAMMKRLKLKKEDLPGGGPDYTNDVTAVTKL